MIINMTNGNPIISIALIALAGSGRTSGSSPEAAPVKDGNLPAA